MSYRDDLEAAQARAEAAERRAEQLQKQLDNQVVVDDAPVVAIPDKFEVTQTVYEMSVRWRWFSPQLWFLLFFVIAWDAFLLFWYFGIPAREGGWLFVVFPIAHVAVGVGLTYRVLTGFVNHTSVSVIGEELRIRHAPLPWRGNRTIRIADLKQLYVEENTHTNDNKTTYTYDLCAVLDDGRQLPLVTKLEKKAQAQYLERAFEQRLRIKDRPVAGEAAK